MPVGRVLDWVRVLVGNHSQVQAEHVGGPKAPKNPESVLELRVWSDTPEKVLVEVRGKLIMA